MSEHTRTGPYEDGTYRYRGWVLVLWEDCREARQSIGLAAQCNQHKRGAPYWVAEPPHEGSLADCQRIATEAGFDEDGSTNPGLGRHVKELAYLLSVEEAIDLWEAGRERLFREAFAQAVSEP